MDDKQAQDMNALELAAFNDPVNFLNTQQNPRKWTLTADEIAQSYSVTPAQLLHTDELSEPKWNVAETLARELWNGAASMFESTAEGVANDKLNQVIYRSNNMDKEDADRLIEDVLRSQVLSRNRQNLEDARQVHDKWSSGIGNGIGSVLSMALVGYATKSPAAVGVLTGLGEKYNARNEMIDRYVNEEGTTEGVAGKLGEYNALSTAYGLFAGAVEASIGVERLAAGSLNRYGKLAALQRLARQQGRYGEALAYKTGREVVASGAEEFGEEFLQSVGEDVAVSLVQDMWEDPDLNKALTQGMFGAIIGAPSGAIFYNGSRKKIIDYINKWNKDKNAGLSDGQVVQMTDEILHNGTHRMLDDITTNVEIRQHFGKAYDLVKQRLTELIDATGTTPWTDKNKSKEQYIQDLADTITIPAINMANKLHIPMSEFLEIADIDTASISGNNIWLKPITSVADLDALIAEQDAIIKDQREKKKLGVGDDTLLNRARTRKAMAERARRDLQVEDAIRTHRTNRRKEKADYITAKDLQPDQVNTLSGAQQATTGQDYVLFGGQRIPVEYEVVELSEIQSSHIDGEINPNYTNKELQNRASRGTTQDVADLKEKASNITPERLLRASTSAEGAPVVNARGEVIAGNGRTEIIRYAYQNPESAEKYKQALVAEGYNIDGMQQPILIRRNTTMTDQEQVAAADISNISETSAFDEASQARMDTKYLKDSKDDVEFASKLPMSERRGLMQNNGKWNKRRVRQRYEDALLAWLCGNDTQLFETMVLDRNLAQKVIDILTTNGSLVYETATKYPELEIREDIYHALVKMQVATRDNFIELTQQLELDGHDVMPENIIVWNWLFADPTTNRQFLSNYVTTLANNQEAVNAGQDMFGQTVPELSKKDALIQALKKADQAKAETAASRGREYAPLFDENGTATDANLAAAIISYQNQFAQQTEEPTLFQEQFDLADENARLDDIYPEYTGETVEVDGKERTVYNSNGDRIAKSKEALTNFWRWFGDSKVVDEQGRPLVVYHSTKADFDTFKILYHKTDEGLSGEGFYFTPSKEYSKRYGDKTLSLYLSVQNMLEIQPTTDEEYTEITKGNFKPSDKNKDLAETLVAKYRNTLNDAQKQLLDWDMQDNMYDSAISRVLFGNKDAKQILKEQGYDGVKYIGKKYDLTEYTVYNNTQIKSVDNRGTYSSDTGNIYYQKHGVIRGFYDPEIQTITLTKYWNETTLVHEFHHRYLEKLFNYFKQAQTGERAVSDEYMIDMQQLFSILDIDPTQDALTTVQQEKFATMVEAYITGLGVDNPENLAFQSFLHWIPEQYKSIMNIGYLDENNNIVNPILDEQTIAWFNKWFANPFAPSLASSPEAQKLVNPTDNNGEIIPSKQKTMNDREKDWGIDSEEQNKADSQLWRAIGENTPTNMRAAMDGEKEHMKAESKNLPDDTKLPETHKPTMREKWFKTYQPNARERAAQMAREYLSKNPEHARELAFADPETGTEYDAPVDRGMLIRAVMETVPHGSDEWYILNDNLATVKSMSGSTLSLSGDQSHRAYLEAKREVEAARELKAAVNYAGTRNGAIDKWNNDIKAFVAKNATAILATEPNSKERQVAIKAFLEEAKTKFSGNTTDAVLNQLDLTGIQTKNSQAFIKWAEKQIKQAAHAKMDTAEQKELMKASIAAQLALQEIDSTVKKDGMFARATQAAKDIRHWQFVKDKMKKAYIGRWGKFGIFMDNLFGSYAPSAMLMSVNTLFFANVPSTAINTAVVRQAAKTIGKNNVDQQVLNDEKERIKQIFNASGVNLAQMEKPSSPSTLHGEKYMNTEQKHWYNFTFEILGRTDNVFRIPTFVDALARIATKNAGGDKAKATALFKEYAKINNQSDDAKIARKQALAVANMAVFTQDGMLSSALNHIRSNLNTLSRGMLGLDPNGFGLGNILAPFLKTGANVVEMGFTGMLAPIRSLGMGLQKLQGKEIPDIKKIALRADWINFALTAVMVALMAALSGDDDWYEEPYQSGKQYDPHKPYDSIKIGGVWVKVDVFGPIAIPLRTAAMGIKDWEKRKFAAIGDGLFEALSDTPLVQQFTDSSLDYMMKKPGAYWSGFAYNQANKLVPAQLKTISKAASRGLGIEKDTSWAGKTIGRKLHRNYGFDGERLTTNDLINVLTNRLKYQPE